LRQLPSTLNPASPAATQLTVTTGPTAAKNENLIDLLAAAPDCVVHRIDRGNFSSLHWLSL